MAILRCKMCNGTLLKQNDGTYLCLYCDTIQTFDEVKNEFNKSENSICVETDESIYNAAKKVMDSASSEIEFKKAISLFSKIKNYKDSSLYIYLCTEATVKFHRIESYKQACELMEQDNIHFLSQAVKIFSELSGFLESNQKKIECLKKIDEQSVIIKKRNKEVAIKRKLILFIFIICFIIIIIYLNSC